MPTLEAEVRRTARKNGCVLRKSRRAISLDNLGGYMIVDANLNCVVAGARHELTIDDVTAHFANA